MDHPLVNQVVHAGKLMAIIVSHRFADPGVNFLTPGDFSQQLAYMRHPAGHVIPPHVHNLVDRQVRITQEVLVIKSGRLRVDFYDDDRSYLESYVLEAGDIILLATGGHGFEVLADLEMIEVKQGPYAGDHDKTRFEGVGAASIRLREGSE